MSDPKVRALLSDLRGMQDEMVRALVHARLPKIADRKAFETFAPPDCEPERLRYVASLALSGLMKGAP